MKKEYVFPSARGMKGILEEREGTEEFLWRERVDTHHWLFEAHSKLHVDLCSRQEQGKSKTGSKNTDLCMILHYFLPTSLSLSLSLVTLHLQLNIIVE